MFAKKRLNASGEWSWPVCFMSVKRPSIRKSRKRKSSFCSASRISADNLLRYLWTNIFHSKNKGSSVIQIKVKSLRDGAILFNNFYRSRGFISPEAKSKLNITNCILRKKRKNFIRQTECQWITSFCPLRRLKFFQSSTRLRKVKREKWIFFFHLHSVVTGKNWCWRYFYAFIFMTHWGQTRKVGEPCGDADH